MNSARIQILHFVSGFIISLLLLVTASLATTQFYLLLENANRGETVII